MSTPDEVRDATLDEVDAIATISSAAFYDDPVKQDCEQRCLDKAFWLRSLSTESGLPWKAQRWARYAVGSIREARHRITAGSPGALNPT